MYCEAGLFHEHKENSGFKPNVFQMRVPQKLWLYIYFFFNTSVFIYKNNAFTLLKKIESKKQYFLKVISYPICLLNFVIFFSYIFLISCMNG